MDHQEKSWLEENAAAVGGGILVVLVVIIILLLIVIYRSIFKKKVCVINVLYCNNSFEHKKVGKSRYHPFYISFSKRKRGRMEDLVGFFHMRLVMEILEERVSQVQV